MDEFRSLAYGSLVDPDPARGHRAKITHLNHKVQHNNICAHCVAPGVARKALEVTKTRQPHTRTVAPPVMTRSTKNNNTYGEHMRPRRRTHETHPVPLTTPSSTAALVMGVVIHPVNIAREKRGTPLDSTRCGSASPDIIHQTDTTLFKSLPLVTVVK